MSVRVLAMNQGNIIVKCGRCHTMNRVPAGKIADRPICGKRGALLPGSPSQGHLVH